MRTAIFAGAACALALLTPAFSKPANPAPFEVGALQVEQPQARARRSSSSPASPAAAGPGRTAPSASAPVTLVYLLTLPGFDGRKPIPGTTLRDAAQDLQKLIETDAHRSGRC